MTSKLKVNLINDSGDNNLITSDGSGNVTADLTAITIDSSQVVRFPTGILRLQNSTTGSADTDGLLLEVSGSDVYMNQKENASIFIRTNNTDRMKLDGAGQMLYQTSDDSPHNNSGGASNKGLVFTDTCQILTAVAGNSHCFNRMSDDGTIVRFNQDGTNEGTISVSGSTVSYNGFTGTHWSRLADNSKPTILKGTILESLDEMMDWYQVEFNTTDEEGNTITHKVSYALKNGQSVGDVITYTYEGKDYQATIIKEADVKHSKCKISDSSESKAVYGVFQAWDNDDDTVNDMYVAQVGTFIVRVNSSVTTLNKGDLIQSNGDGTGKVQSDDIIRASTVAKVLSTTKIETYADGSYTVPCSLHC